MHKKILRSYIFFERVMDMKDKIISINQFKTQKENDRKKEFSQKIANIINFKENIVPSSGKSKAL